MIISVEFEAKANTSQAPHIDQFSGNWDKKNMEILTSLCFQLMSYQIIFQILNAGKWENFRISDENTTNYKQREGNYFTSYSSCVRRLSSPLCVFWQPESYNAAKTCCSLQSSDREGQMQLLVVFVILNLILQQGDNFRLLCKILLSRKKRKRNSKSD